MTAPPARFIIHRLILFMVVALAVVALAQPFALRAAPHVAAPTIEWTHLSSVDGDLTVDGPQQQVAALVFDIDRDGLNDFVLGGRRAPSTMVWYRRVNTGWERYVIDDARLDIEAGGTFADIDGDNDLDVVMGEGSNGNHVYWWENPYPTYDPATPWNRYEIKNSGANKHHDQLFGNFDDDPALELVFWNQDGSDDVSRLFLADIPADPKATQPWPYTEIFTGSNNKFEGLTSADINTDGKADIVGGGYWFEHTGGTSYTPHVIAADREFTRSAAGQLIPGGRPEVVIGPGDTVGRLKLYTWNDTTAAWDERDLLGIDVDHGHSLDVVDINNDGHLDIFCAEMRLNGGNADAKMWALLGDGQGNFTPTVIAEGYGNHESRVADLDGDGDLDILGKPFNWDTPRIDIWLQEAPTDTNKLQLDAWQRHVIDDDRPWRSIFIRAADMDGDSQQDIITGGWWYQNPGTPDGTWRRQTIGEPLNNMALVADFDGNGSPDVLGTQGQGDDSNATFALAINDGSGSFTIAESVAEGDGDFLQGVAFDDFTDDGTPEVALSWHAGGTGVQTLEVPADPLTMAWPWQQISTTSQDEGLSAGDIDRDGDTDLLLGTQWLRNNGTDWSAFTLHDSGSEPPDRNRLADINGDGRLDAVIGYETLNSSGILAWYEQGTDATAPWQEHVIATMYGPMSVDVIDMDNDGDADVVAGEHNLSSPETATLYVFENEDGQGMNWIEHTVYVGDEHHDGARVADIDNDGDQDIMSIGWGHSRVVLYENRAITSKNPPPAETPTSIFLPFTRSD